MHPRHCDCDLCRPSCSWSLGLGTFQGARETERLGQMSENEEESNAATLQIHTDMLQATKIELLDLVTYIYFTLENAVFGCYGIRILP